jgi:rod shape-determining protein MreD
MDRTPGIRLRPSLWRRLDAAAHAGLPASSTVILILLTQIPLWLPGQPQLLLAVSIVCVWCWSLARPRAIPPASVFLIGLLVDLLGYQPLSVGALSLLILHAFALRWRRSLLRFGFVTTWLAFIPAGCAVIALGWALTSLLNFQILPTAGTIFACALTIAVYPLIALMVASLNRRLNEAEALAR